MAKDMANMFKNFLSTSSNSKSSASRRKSEVVTIRSKVKNGPLAIQIDDYSDEDYVANSKNHRRFSVPEAVLRSTGAMGLDPIQEVSLTIQYPTISSLGGK